MPARSWPLAPPGSWVELPSPAPLRPGPALFLDRDGTLIEDRGYVADPADVALLPGMTALVAAANAAGIPVAVVSNQSGIDRGLFGWESFAAVQAEIARQLARGGARIDAVAACPFHPDFTAGYGAVHARWRKPGPAMIEVLAQRLGVVCDRSWLVGDAARDVEAARAAGLCGAVLIAAPRARDMATARGTDERFSLRQVADTTAVRAALDDVLFAGAGAGAAPDRRRS